MAESYLMLYEKDFYKEDSDRYIHCTLNHKNNIPVFQLDVDGDFNEDKKENWQLFVYFFLSW